ncbi:MAG: signal peptidase II [Bacillota bacterium]
MLRASAVEYSSFGVSKAGIGGRYVIFWAAFLLVAASDYLSKNWVRANLALGETRQVIGNFLRFTHWSNSGASFGILQGASPYLALVSVGCIILSILIYPKVRGYGPSALLSLGLISGGALGNLIDRVRFGSVTDFISLRFFSPIFNVADSAIVVGAVIMVFFFLFAPEGSFGD